MVAKGSGHKTAREFRAPTIWNVVRNWLPTMVVRVTTFLCFALFSCASTKYTHPSKNNATTMAPIRRLVSGPSHFLQGPSYVMRVKGSHSPHAMLSLFLPSAHAPGTPPGQRRQSAP